MRYLVLAIALLSGCGSPGKPTVTNTTVRADPHGSRDALVQAAFAAVSAGDGDALVALGDIKNVLTRAMRCPASSGTDKVVALMEDALRTSVLRAKGVTLAVVSSAPSDKVERLVKGSREGECEALVDAVFQKVDVKLAVTGRSGKAEGTLKVGLVELEGRFYLAELELELHLHLEDSTPRVSAIIETMVDKSQQMCACKDHACAKAVDAEYKVWIAKVADTADKTDKPSERDAQRFADAAQRYSECAAKAMTPPAP